LRVLHKQMTEHKLGTIYFGYNLEAKSLAEHETKKTLLGFELDELENTRYDVRLKLSILKKTLYRLNERIEHLRLEIEEGEFKERLDKRDKDENA
jgi:hypothetical protein